MSDPAFALLHPGVQKAIWSMGWKEFRPIQVESIHQVLEKSGHLIITAQTAGGKTEAAFLPVISKLAENRQPSIQAIYIGPLKALINDQFSRLEILCNNLELPVHRWHGDVSASHKKELRQSPAGILLITPESLESNFINYGTQLQRLYSHLEFVVIDELHSFLNNERGIHLLSLLSRLNQSAGTNPRIIGLSATLGDPSLARKFLCPTKSESVTLISDPNSQRDTKFGIRAYLRRPQSSDDKVVEPRITANQALLLAEKLNKVNLQNEIPCSKETAPELEPVKQDPQRASDDDLDEIAADIINHFTTATNLIFVNSKKTIENLAAKLHDGAKRAKLPADPFVVHHGSISKELREEAELQLKSGTPTTAICSSTLEMGIDIGSVKMIGQVGTPWSVASTVQRLGRSGRHDGEPQVMRMYVRETSPNFGSKLTDLLYPGLLRAIAITRLMLKQWLEPPELDQIHASTMIHQIMSCLKQTGGTSATNLYDTLVKKGPFQNVPTDFFKSVLSELGNRNVIEQVPQGDLILAPLGEKITSSFDFYAAFRGADEYFVRSDEGEIGTLPAEHIPPIGEVIILAGRRWAIDEINIQLKTIFVKPARGGKAPEFICPSADLNGHLVGEMRQILSDTDEPAWLDNNAKLLLRAARTVATNSGLNETNLLFRPHKVQWFPWIGSKGILTLKTFALRDKIRHENDHLSITYEIELPNFIEHLQEIVNSTASASGLASLLPVKAVEKYDELLSDDLLNIVNGQNHLDLDEAEKAAANTLSGWRRPSNISA